MTNFKKIRNTVKWLASISQNDHTIVPYKDGYRVSNRFAVRHSSFGWSVTDDYTDREIEFVEIRTALAYCMALNANNRALAKELHTLDSKYHRKQFDVQNKIYLLSNSNMDSEMRAIMVIKLDEDVKISKYLKIELQKRLNLAKYIKVKGSHYEFTGIDKNCQ